MHKLGPCSVGFELHIASKTADHFCAIHLRRIVKITAACENISGRREHRGGGLLGRAPAVVVFCNVAYFMSNHACEFRLGFEVSQQPSIHINEPAGQGKGIDVGRIEQSKGKGIVRPGRIGDQALANRINVGCRLRVVINTNGIDETLVFIDSNFRDLNLPPPHRHGR